MPDLIKLPAVDRFFNTPELLNMVFKIFKNDKRFHVVNAQVSKMWSELALDYIWHELRDLQPVFEVLAPMKVSPKTGFFRFITMPSAAQWRHFEKYSRRVRSIRHLPEEQEIDRSAFHSIAETRINLRIFPNLHTLHWNESLDPDLSVIFMHSGISKLFLECPDADRLTTAGTLLDPSRMPGITHLRLHMAYNVYTMDTEITPLLSSLHSLEELEILPNHFTPTMVQSLSRLQALRVITMGSPWFVISDDIVFPEILTFGKGAFPVLEQVELGVVFSDAVRFIEAVNGPENVETIRVDSEYIESLAAYEILLIAIATHYKDVTSIDLLSRCKWSFSQSLESFTIDILKPLLMLSNLVRLSIPYCAWGLHDKDLEIISLAFPFLEHLDLNPSMALKTASNLTLHAILPFAHHCPRLRFLGLPLITAGLSIDRSREAFQRTPRMKLRRFQLGPTDHAAKPDTVAFLLSWVFPKECQLSQVSKNREWFTNVKRLFHLFLETQGGQKLL